MRGRDNQTALCAMGLHHAGDFLPRSPVERRQRLVQQPERTVSHEQPGQRRAPFLAGGEGAKGRMERVGKTDGRQRLSCRQTARVLPAAEIRRPEIKVF